MNPRLNHLLTVCITIAATFLPSTYAQSGLAQVGEFKINTFSSGEQTHASVASAPDGRFVVVWLSSGQDGSGESVYAQRYKADASPIGVPIRVDQNNKGALAAGPTCAMDANANFVVVWTGPGELNVYGRAFRADGTARTNEFAVNSASGANNGSASVGMADDGHFVVVWHRDVNASDKRVFAKLYSAAGDAATGEEILVGDTGGFDYIANIAMGANGAFVVVWTGNSNAIKAQRFNVDGTKNGPRITPINSPSAAEHNTAAVALNRDGSYAVVWVNTVSGAGDIAMQIVGPDNQLKSAGDLPVNTFTAGDQGRPSVAVDDEGIITVIWQSQNADAVGGYAVRGRRFAANGTAIDAAEFPINQTTAGNQNTSGDRKALAVDIRGNFVAVWETETPTDGREIFADRWYSEADIAEFRVSSGTLNDQATPCVAVTASGNGVVAWRSDGDTPADAGIYFQLLDANGRRVGPERRASTGGISTQGDPAVAMTSGGDFVIFWEGGANGMGGNDIVGQQFNADGSKNGSGLQANTHRTTAKLLPAVTMKAKGEFVVAWSSMGQDGDSGGIYLQRYVGGVQVGPETQVNTPTARDQTLPFIAMNSLGEFNVLYRGWDGNGVDTGVYARRFNADGTSKDTTNPPEFRVNQINSGSESYCSAVLLDSGRFIVAFDRQPTGDAESDIYVQRFDGTTPVGDEILVNQVTNGRQYYPSLAGDSSGNFVVTWRTDLSQDASGLSVVVRRFLATGEPLSQIESLVNVFTPGDQRVTYSGHAIAADQLGNYFLVWDSAGQDGSGYGVYATRVIVNEVTTVRTVGSSSVAGIKATLQASIDPNGQVATVAFEYDEDVNFNSPGVVQVPGSFSGLNPQDVAVEVTQGLTKGVKYYFRAKATVGANVIVGNVLDFTTANAAPAATDDRIFIAGKDATLDVLANDTDPDLPGDGLALAPEIPQIFAVVDGQATDVVAGALGQVTLGNRSALSFSANSAFTDRARFTYVVHDADGLTDSATVDLFRFKTLSGIYSGQVQDVAGVEPVGALKITINATAGGFTGTLFWGGTRYVFESAFSADGSVTLGVAGAPLQFTLRVVDAIAGTISGTLTDNAVPSQPITATIDLARENSLIDEADRPEPGSYTTFIDTPEIVNEPPGTSLVPREDAGGAHAASDQSITGTGYSVAKVGSKKQRSRARFVTALADGARFSAGSGLAGRGYSLVQTLYNIKKGVPGGSFNSQPTFALGNNRRFESAVGWVRPAIPGIPGSEFFPNGFRLKITLAGIRYNAQFPFPINFGQSTGNNAVVIFRGGGLDEDKRAFMNVNAQNRVLTNPADQVTLKINKVAGIFSGSFGHPGESKPVKFIGLFQQSSNGGADGVNERGLGYFRALTSKKTGRVEMRRN